MEELMQALETIAHELLGKDGNAAELISRFRNSEPVKVKLEGGVKPEPTAASFPQTPPEACSIESLTCMVSELQREVLIEKACIIFVKVEKNGIRAT